MKKSFLLLVLISLFFAGPAVADICNDINSLSNDWNDVADLVHEYEDDGFTRAEEQEVNDVIDALLDETEALGETLEIEGNRKEAAFGSELIELVIDVEETEYLDELVDVMDDIVDELDALVDYCDSL